MIPKKLKTLYQKLKALRQKNILRKLKYWVKQTKCIFLLKKAGVSHAVQVAKKMGNAYDLDYLEWIKKAEAVELVKETSFSYEPLISILLPVYNVPTKWLKKCIDSVINQTYTKWELCIADDASTNRDLGIVLKEYEKKDTRIKVIYREKNGHICEATNSALSLATGEFVGLLDNDDELSHNALSEVVARLNENPETDLLYSDEDKIDIFGNRSNPLFKPDWSPDWLLSVNYVCHFGVYRKELVEKIGGFRKGYEGAQDYDLVLRFTENMLDEKIVHIPKILYHWRMLDTSTAGNQDSKGYAFEAGKKVLEETLQRRKIKGSVKHSAANGMYMVSYDIEHYEKVSIIILIKDTLQVASKIMQIRESISYKNYEMILISEHWNKEEIQNIEKEYHVKCMLAEALMTDTQKMNQAVQQAKGKYLLFLNEKIEGFSGEWIETMVSFAQIERIGVVGVKICDKIKHEIRHAGTVLEFENGIGFVHRGFAEEHAGYFGKLITNVNYLAVSAECAMLKKEDFIMEKGYNETLEAEGGMIDLCIRLYEKEHKYNLWTPSVKLYSSEETHMKISKETEAYLKKNWKAYVQKDPYYNKNLSVSKEDFSVRIRH